MRREGKEDDEHAGKEGLASPQAVRRVKMTRRHQCARRQRVGDSNCGGLFCWSDLCRNSQHVYSRLSCRLQRLRNLRLLPNTNKSTDFHVFPKPFPTAGLTAQLHKQSPVGTTRQLSAVTRRAHSFEKKKNIPLFSFFFHCDLAPAHED